jgi:hypothetical protein
MRFWFDTEFIEDGRTIDLISIGIVSEDGREWYAESNECDLSKASPWVKDNVIPHLIHGYDAHVHMSRKAIANAVVSFVGTDKPEIWAYYAAYDWVALCQLFGTMMDLPKGWPMFVRDVKQLCVDVGNPRLPSKSDVEHNAISDARWTKQAWDFLQEHKS